LRKRLTLVAAIGAGLIAWAAPPANAARGIDLGITDGVYTFPAGAPFDGGTFTEADRDFWFNKTDQSGADLVILGVNWGFKIGDLREPANPTNPCDPAYHNWEPLDEAVRDATQRGLQVVLRPSWAPKWAEGDNPPDWADDSTWKPRPSAVGDFGSALAKRYSGNPLLTPCVFPSLPRVSDYMLWPEANLSSKLTPQFRNGDEFSPDHYRKMINAFYDGVNDVNSSFDVITTGLAPFGDDDARGRMRPVRWWREFLCLKGHKLRKARCPNPAHFDIAAHNPISHNAPTRHAINRDDASTPDVGRIKRVINKARRTGRVKPKGKKPFWATEFYWDTDPPGISQQKQARWLQQATYLFWKQGVKLAVWFQIKDQEPRSLPPNWVVTYQTGLCESNGACKPAFDAFQFPFVGDRLSKKKVRVWGKAPGGGPVQIQRNGQTVKTVSVPGSHVFVDTIRLRGSATLRAVQGSNQSIPWDQG
jgi:hypothetical protein